MAEAVTPAAAATRQFRLRHGISYLLLLGAKAISRVFYRLDLTFIGTDAEDAWTDIRLAAFLNHTSLFEWLFAAAAPNKFLRRMASETVLPSADKTMKRPLVGTFYRFLAGDVVTVTRERDETWEQVLGRIDRDNMVLLAPEGRMMRANGLDLAGNPMTVRGGVADILRIMGNGRMLIAYSGGLHHVQAPGERLPRLFKTIRLAIEVVDIAEYIASIGHAANHDRFRQMVKAELERRRDLHCPTQAAG
ncbi:MAG: 1-acyl-sn-glycerol-3-phosphate acyltransferase [Thermoanaerobaculia bacterium]